jgi:hypothetical protein
MFLLIITFLIVPDIRFVNIHKIYHIRALCPRLLASELPVDLNANPIHLAVQARDSRAGFAGLESSVCPNIAGRTS